MEKEKRKNSKNHMALMRETESDTSKLKDILCLWIVRINIVKMSILLKAIYRFKVIPVKIPMAFLNKKRKNNTKIFMESQRPQIDKAIPRKNKAGGITPLDFKLYCKVLVIETVWNWHKNRHIDQ